VAFSGGTESNTYTVATGDSLASIATQLTSKLNGDSKLTAIGLSATVNNAGLSAPRVFSGNATLPTGTTTNAVAAVDGGSNQVTNNYQLSVKGPATQVSCYDYNGNLLSDGTNTYQWDAENRLVQINYAGLGNNSAFTYDPFGRVVKIVETVSSTVTSTKQLVWSDGAMKEARDATGAVTAQYFWNGQTISGSSYFYTKDHLGSIRELTDSSGNIQAAYSYDVYGRIIKIQGSLASDFQYAGYYMHAPSGLNLAVHRAYSASLGRWINRDPAGSEGGFNLYAYVLDDPVGATDPSGLASVFPANPTPRKPDRKKPNCFPDCVTDDCCNKNHND
jgi:RHS repeat-associated protein